MKLRESDREQVACCDAREVDMVEYDITGRISCAVYPSGEDFRRSKFERLLREMVLEDR